MSCDLLVLQLPPARESNTMRSYADERCQQFHARHEGVTLTAGQQNLKRKLVAWYMTTTAGGEKWPVLTKTRQIALSSARWRNLLVRLMVCIGYAAPGVVFLIIGAFAFLAAGGLGRHPKRPQMDPKSPSK
jgi:hypothetical protein